MQEIDTHNMKFQEAKEYILTQAEQCYKQKILSLRVIHGYNNGTKIRDWIRNTERLNKIVNRVEPDLLNSGATILHFKLRIY